MSIDVSARQRSMDEYTRMRRAAMWRAIQATLMRHPYLLIPFEEVRERLYGVTPIDRGVRTIPLRQIVGSLGRARDFTRDFLPRNETTFERWRSVHEALEHMSSLPPIEVYQVGEVYFVSDGHHRISVARAMGAPDIDAHVLEVPIRAAMQPDMPPDAILRAAEKAGFLARTGLDETRPQADLEVTLPRGYSTLGRQVELLWEAARAKGELELPLSQAAARWYDEIYKPIVQAIRETGWQRDFPRRTEADLYIWLMEHLSHLQAQYGAAVDAELALEDFHAQRSGGLWQRLLRAARGALARVYGDATPRLVERLVDRYEEREIERLVDELAIAERWMAELEAEEAGQREA